MNEIESSTWISYDVAAVTSLQSNVTGCAGVASFAGDTSVGADGVAGGAGGLTPIDAKRIVSTTLAES